MREDADFNFDLNCEIFDNFSQLVRIFINILLVIEYQRTQSLQHKQLRNATFMRRQLQLPQQFSV